MVKSHLYSAKKLFLEDVIMFQKGIFTLMSLVLLFSLGFSSIPSKVLAKSTESEEIDLATMDLSKVKNLEQIISEYSLSKTNVTTSYSMQKGEGVINLHDTNKDIWVNLYVSNNVVEFQSLQKELENGNVSFNLFSNEFTLVASEIIEPNGSLVNQPMSKLSKVGTPTKVIAYPGGGSTTSINPAAFKWACIFSSYLACIGVSVAVGAAGALVSGPFGIAAGFAGGAACRYVFQTLVETYGSKDKACKILS